MSRLTAHADAPSQPTRLRAVFLLMTLGYPLALHIALLNGKTRAALWLLFTVALGHALLPRPSAQRGTRLVAAGVTLLAVIGLAIHDISALYLPPILISAALLYLFGGSLLPGEEPLVTRFAGQLDGELDARTLRYTRGVTGVWALFFAAMLLECLLLTWLAPLEVWSLFTNVVNYFLIGSLFLLEYVYRLIYFRRWPTLKSLGWALDRQRLLEWLKG